MSSAHPEISSLIRLKDQARELRIARKYEPLIETLYALMDELKAEDRDKEIHTEMEKEIQTLSNFTYEGQRKKWLKKYAKKYLEWYRVIIQILWDKHYLENEKYGMVYPANLPKSNAYKSPLLSQP